jgi:hypothetical protein
LWLHVVLHALASVHAVACEQVATLELEHVYGRTATPDLFVTAERRILYAAAALG